MNFSTNAVRVNWSECRRVYLVGIKGVGMTSLAIMLQQRGMVVSGADTVEEFVTDRLLDQHEILVDTFNSAYLPPETDLVIYSGAHAGIANPLVVEAQGLGIEVLSHAQALGALTKLKTTIGVAGVGGKSTTSALLAWMLETTGEAVSYSIGVGDVPNLGSSGRWRKEGRYLVVEADEYVADPKADITPRFLYLYPTHLICTSLSFDHPDVYQSLDDTKQAFAAVLDKLSSQSCLVYNGDSTDLAQLVESHPGQFRRISVGEGKHNDVRLSDFKVSEGLGQLQLNSPGGIVDGLKLSSRVPGKHNLLNSAYAAVMALELGASHAAVERACASFRSTKRRFEYIGQTTRGAHCYDDYAHHPREIEAVGQALHDWFPNQSLAVAFEPHTFSRTKALYQDFLSALAGLNCPVYLLPIFASAREAADDSINSQMLVSDLQRRGVEAHFCADQSALLEYVQASTDNAVFITLGAGTIYKVYEHVDFRVTAESLS